MASAAGTAKRISQETFDAAVLENIEEFDMVPAEALTDAVQQFVQQGVDLSNIVTTGEKADKDSHPVLVELNKLRTLLEDEDAGDASATAPAVAASLVKLQEACRDNSDHKSVAGTNGVMEVLASVCASHADEPRVIEATYRSFRVVVQKHAENRKLIRKEILESVTGTLKSVGDLDDDELLGAALGCAYSLAFKHEQRKVALFKAGAADTVLSIMHSHVGKPSVLKDSFSLLRSLVTPDDRSASTSKAFDHARELHDKGAVEELIAVGNTHKTNAAVLADVFSTFAAMCVTNTICADAVEGGILELIVGAFGAFPTDARLAATGLSSLRALAGNDDNKKLICKDDAPVLKAMLKAMQSHLTTPKAQEQACTALAALSLRMPENAEVIVANDGHTLIIQAMRKHTTVTSVQGAGCLAIRNIVSRAAHLRPQFVELGVELLLRGVYAAHPRVKDKAKAALRDLGCDYDDLDATVAAAK